MIKRMVIMLILVGAVFAGIFGFQAFKAKMIKQALAALSAPPQTVSTAVADEQQWQAQLTAVGSLKAVKGADLSPQVSGIVAAIHFESGTDVKEGTLLVELLAADDIAKLQALKATAALAKITYDRDQRQLKAQAVSQQTVDADEQTLKSDVAQVAEQQATVDYKFIRAPFAGRLGIRQVDLGQYLGAGSAVVTLQQLDPIYVDFYLPEQALDEIKVGQQVAAAVDTYPGQSFPGTITAINAKVDTTTRNVLVRATLKNPDDKLLPGMYATVAIDAGAPKSYVTLPQTAVAYNPYGSTVYLVAGQGGGQTNGGQAKDGQANGGQGRPIAHQTFVTTGATRGDQVAVLTGVKAGDTVVTSGQIKLHNGSPLLIDNSVKPLSDAHPTPPDE